MSVPSQSCDVEGLQKKLAKVKIGSFCPVIMLKGGRKNHPCGKVSLKDSVFCKIHHTSESSKPTAVYVENERNISALEALEDLDLDHVHPDLLKNLNSKTVDSV